MTTFRATFEDGYYWFSLPLADPKEDQQQIIPVYKFELILYSLGIEIGWSPDGTQDLLYWQSPWTMYHHVPWAWCLHAGLPPPHRLYTIFPPVARGWRSSVHDKRLLVFADARLGLSTLLGQIWSMQFHAFRSSRSLRRFAKKQLRGRFII
jgi:hypothetical protein